MRVLGIDPARRYRLGNRRARGHSFRRWRVRSDLASRLPLGSGCGEFGRRSKVSAGCTRPKLWRSKKPSSPHNVQSAFRLGERAARY